MSEPIRKLEYQGKVYAMGPDNGCFYRYASLQMGVCEGDATHEDRFGNRYCDHHWARHLSADA